MLAMRPCCECCQTALPAEADGAWICSFECTFCTACTETVLAGRCPNCAGSLRPRPSRTLALQARHPASTERIVKPAGCQP